VRVSDTFRKAFAHLWFIEATKNIVIGDDEVKWKARSRPRRLRRGSGPYQKKIAKKKDVCQRRKIRTQEQACNKNMTKIKKESAEIVFWIRGP